MRPTHAVPALLALLAAAACSTNVTITGGTTTGHGTGGGAGTGGTGTGGGATSDVTGSVVNRYYGEAAPVDVPVDLTGYQVEAFVQQGSAWQTFPGSGKADGTFTIPGVPDGWFMLDVAGTYVFTKARQLDLGTEVSGRPGALTTQGNATVGGNLQNLSPWQSTDFVEWTNPNAGGAAYAFSAAMPAAGATSLSGQASVWIGALVDGAKGDVLYVSQLRAQSGGAAPYYSAVRFLSFPGVEQKDGSLTSVSGTLLSVTADQKITLDYRGSEFDKLGAQVNPGATAYASTLDLATLPGAAEAGFIGFNSDLLVAYPSSGDVKLGPMAYGNPYPAAWGTSLYAGKTWSMMYGSAVQYASVYVTVPVAQAVAGPIRPGVTPVANLTVDGKQAFGPLTGISLTPTLAWGTASAITPTGYRIIVYEVSGANVQYVTEVATTATTVPLPPGVLQKGHGYALTVTALVSAVDAASAPFRNSSTFAAADALTSLLQP